MELGSNGGLHGGAALLSCELTWTAGTGAAAEICERLKKGKRPRSSKEAGCGRLIPHGSSELGSVEMGEPALALLCEQQIRCFDRRSES